MVQPIPWYVAIFQSIPETFLILMLGFSIFNYSIQVKEALLISTLCAVFSYWIHHLPLIFGMHTVLLIVLCTLLVVLIAKKNLFKAFLSVVGGLTFSISLQGILVPIIFSITKLNMQLLQKRPWLYLMVFLPTAIGMTILYFLIRKKRFYIIDFDSRTNEFENI